MNTDRNLLFGVLALQVDLIDAQQFAEVCTHWTAKKEKSLGDILIELGWISQTDKSDIERFVERKLQKHNGDVQASLAASADNAVHRTLAQVDDKEIEGSLVRISESPSGSQVVTIDYVPETKERYSLSRLHAGGGLGRVWIARDCQLGRDVALKEIHPQKADDPKVLARFVNEAQITGQLEHPGVVPVYELAHRPDDQQPFYTMRFVKGRTLREAVREYHQKKAEKNDDAFDLVGLLNALVAVCNTIAYAHSRGVIHRDLKGENIILGDFGEVLVLDWGLAKLIAQTDEEISTQLVQFDTDDQLTMHGEALGTPAYMAPEQAQGKLDQIDLRTDIYGLGAILYEILVGQPPFTGSDVMHVLKRIVTENPIRPSQLSDDIPENLENVCLRALAKNPADRFQSASELADEVQQWQEVQRQQAIQALKDSEALYHGLVETLPLVIWRKDREGHFTFSNQGFCDVFGWQSGEIIGKTDFDFASTKLAEKYRRDDMKIMETGNCLELEEESMSASGESIQVRTFKAPVRNAQGDIIGTQGFCWDITEHKKMEQELEETIVALKESEALYHGLVQSMPLVLWRKDGEGRFTFASQGALDLFGWPSEEVIGKTDFDLMPVHFAEKYRRDDMKIMETGDCLELEEETKNARGERIHARTFKAPVRNANGDIVGTQGFLWNVTELKRLDEEALKE